MIKLWRGLSIILLLCGMAISPGCKKDADTGKSDQPKPVQVEVQKQPDWSKLTLGEPVSFEMKYRGISGSEDDIDASSGWYGFGTSDSSIAPFFKAVKDQTDNELVACESSYFPGDSPGVFEYSGNDILALYFDLNGDGELADNEKISPTENASSPFGDGKCFITPDFQKKSRNGSQIPFRIMACTNQNGDNKPNVYWTPMGMYEGSAKIEGEEYKVYLFAPFHADSYTKYGSSSIGIVKAAEAQKHVSSNTLSSINYFNEKFYRIKFDDADASDNILTATIAEDKGKRGKVAVKLTGKEALKADLTYAIVNGAKERSINFRFTEGLNELPVGDYKISYGQMKFGKETTDEFRTTFENATPFTIEADKTTEIELGNIKTIITAVEYNKRYNGDKEYKSKFAENTHVYVDVDFIGNAKESYRDFNKLVKNENRTNSEGLPVHITITDQDNNQIASEDLEYG